MLCRKKAKTQLDHRKYLQGVMTRNFSKIIHRKESSNKIR